MQGFRLFHPVFCGEGVFMIPCDCRFCRDTWADPGPVWSMITLVIMIALVVCYSKWGW